MSDMKLDNFRLLVNDFAASFHFWHEIVGLELIYRDENNIYAYFEAGLARLELIKADYFAASVGATQPALIEAEYRGVVVFRADDVDATYADLVKRGAPPLAPRRITQQGLPVQHCWSLLMGMFLRSSRRCALFRTGHSGGSQG
jgi:lactoylglutathione lyase